MIRTGAQALIEALLEEGTEVVFGYPGGAIMPAYDALYDMADRIRHVLVRHEQGAAHAAQGYARVTGRVGACLVTSGPGATNLITGLADALMDSTPLVCVCGQVRSELLGANAFQEADVIGMSLAATKWSYQITDPAEVPTVIARAFDVARSGRPGPVLVDITRDAQSGEFDDGGPRFEAAGLDPDRVYRRPGLDRSRVQAAADLINTAERPYLLVGQGVLLSGAGPAARALAERSGMPVAATLLGLSAVPADHPLYVGMLGMHGNYGANRLTNESDVIVAVGMRFDDRVTGRLEDYAPRARVVHVDIDPSEIDRNVPAEVAIVADAREALEALIPLVEQRTHPGWLARFRADDAVERTEVIDQEVDPRGGTLRMGEVEGRISAMTNGEAIIVSDVGQHQMLAARHYRFRVPNSHVTSGGLGTMGFALPAALGAKLGAPGRQVIAVVGDGGFQMSIQELGTLMQERLAVKLVILNNEHLGMVRQWQELFFRSRYSFVAMENPDFVTVCRGYGIEAQQVASRDALDEALEAMLSARGPYLLDVRVGRLDNVFPMIPAGASVSEIRLS